MRKAIEISIENTSEQKAILIRNIIKTHTLDFVNQVKENEAFNPRDKNDLVVADNSWMNKLPEKKETVSGRDNVQFVAIGDWNGNFRNTDFKQVTTLVHIYRYLH